MTLRPFSSLLQRTISRYRYAMNNFYPKLLQHLSAVDYWVITNVYPSEDDLYKNAFVHSRVKAYQRQGLHVRVMVIRHDLKPNLRHHDGVEVLEVHPQSAIMIFRNSKPQALCFHFLNALMWKVIESIPRTIPKIIWVHGYEIQAWWRRPCLYETDAQREAGKKLWAERQKLWHKVLEDWDDIYLVFVSSYLAKTALEDLKINLDCDRYSCIPNPIDTDRFSYEEKPVEQRLRILSIRPYASKIYANDIAVKTVLALKDKSFFHHLSFHFIGDGPLFDETLASIKNLPEVTCERRFLTPKEIATLHKDYGLFLVPTRMDSHGVSRDEAMSSGLVPLTSRVAAIPEFTDESCAILAPPEDHQALVDGIEMLYYDSDRFLHMSRSAAHKVRAISASSITIAAEIEFLSNVVENT